MLRSGLLETLKQQHAARVGEVGEAKRIPHQEAVAVVWGVIGRDRCSTMFFGA